MRCASEEDGRCIGDADIVCLFHRGERALGIDALIQRGAQLGGIELGPLGCFEQRVGFTDVATFLST